MINLLNPSDKRHLRAARRNTIWLRYTLLLIACFVAMNAVFGITAWYIYGQENSYKETLGENESRRDNDYLETKERAATFRGNLATAKIILDGQTNYSNVITAIAATLPKNCNLEALSLNNQLFDTPQLFSSRCKSQADSLGLKTALQINSNLFKDVSIVVTSQSTGAPGNTYPIAVTLSATLLKPPINGEKAS